MVAPKIIKVLLVDDNELLRRGLRSALETCDDMEVVGEAGNGLVGIEMCRELRPDVVLMDMKMPKMNGLEATRIICKEFPKIGVVILSNSLGFSGKEEALQVGAKGYLHKSVRLDDIIDAIHDAAK